MYTKEREGLKKEAFDIQPLLHWVQHYDPHYIRDAVRGLSIGGALEGTKRWFGARGANLLNKGIEMGKENQKMSPFLETVSTNFLGKSKLSPYHEGLQLGNAIREKGLNPEQEAHFLAAKTDEKLALKQEAEAAGKKAKDPILNAYDDFQTGKYRHHPVFNGLIGSNPISQEQSGLAGKVVGNALTLPIAKVIDPTAMVRPILRKVESHPVIENKINTMMPEGTKKRNLFSKMRQFID